MQEQIQWKMNVPIFKNNLILKQLGLAIGIPFGILILFLIIVTKASIYALYSVGIIIALLFLTWIFVLIIYGGKYNVEFSLDSKGVLSKTQANQRKKNKIINGLTFILGLLSKKPTVAGTSILAESRQEVFIPWKQISKVNYIAKTQTILLKGDFAENIALFCTRDNYPIVEEFVIRKTQKNE